jgi:hypothetical protein
MNPWILALTLFCSAPAFADGDWTHFGNAFTVTDKPIASADFLADPSKFEGQTVMIEGRVADVCQKAGCWLVLAEGDKSIRIRTKAHRFFVAKDSTGKMARIEGLVKSHKVDAKQVAHYESESQKGAVVPEKQANSETVFELIASGVSIQK